MDQFKVNETGPSHSPRDQAWVHWLYSEEEGNLFYKTQKRNLFLEPFQELAFLLVIDVIAGVIGLVAQLVFSSSLVLVLAGGFFIFLVLFYLYSLFANIRRLKKLQKGTREIFLGPFGVWQDGVTKDFRWLSFVDFSPGNPGVIEFTGFDQDPTTFAGKYSGFKMKLPVPLDKEEDGKKLVESFQAIIQGDLKKANALAQTLSSAPARKNGLDSVGKTFPINRKPKK